MCTLLFSYGNHPKYKLILAANRDEFYARPTQEAHWWKDQPNILAGRDAQAGGTWLGITKQGRIAAITNYRKFPHEKGYPTSRGALVIDFLTSDCSPHEYLQQLEKTRDEFDGYNLIFGTTLGLYYFSNRSAQNGPVYAGIHGLSNHLLNTPWPKVEYGKTQLDSLITDEWNEDQLFRLMKRTTQAPDEMLPQTGVGLEWERQLSPLFIEMDNYGTRVTTLVLIDNEGKVKFKEVGFMPPSEKEFTFHIGT